MTSSPDDALRERARFDENAAELLRLAVERGLISEKAADTAVSEVKSTDSTTVCDSGASWVVDALHNTGVLDHQSLHSLASEMGLFDSDISVPDDVSGVEEPLSDPFDQLNKGVSTTGDGEWGSLGSSAHWDGERFDRVRQSPDREERAELYDRLVSVYKLGQHLRGAYIDFDSGLQVLSERAHLLG